MVTLSAVSCCAFAALAKSPLFANQPIVEATITKIDVGKLAKAPWLRQIHHLIVRGSITGAKGFAQIVASPNAQQLTALNVTMTNLNVDAIKSLKSYLPALRSFVLTGNVLGSDGIAALIAWPHLATIETLYLSKCGLTTADVAKLLSKPLPNLVKLTLAENQIDNTIGKVLATAASNVPKTIATRRRTLVSTPERPMPIAAAKFDRPSAVATRIRASTGPT